MDNPNLPSEQNERAERKFAAPRQIRTEFWAKPMPFRGCDWTAVFDGYEPGCALGYGATESEAIHDLLQLVE